MVNCLVEILIPDMQSLNWIVKHICKRLVMVISYVQVQTCEATNYCLFSRYLFWSLIYLILSGRSWSRRWETWRRIRRGVWGLWGGRGSQYFAHFCIQNIFSFMIVLEMGTVGFVSYGRITLIKLESFLLSFSRRRKEPKVSSRSRILIWLSLRMWKREILMYITFCLKYIIHMLFLSNYVWMLSNTKFVIQIEKTTELSRRERFVNAYLLTSFTELIDKW